jgi:hypothetical protein
MCPCLDVREYVAHKKTNLGSAAFFGKHNYFMQMRDDMG